MTLAEQQERALESLAQSAHAAFIFRVDVEDVRAELEQAVVWALSEDDLDEEAF